MVPHTRFEPIEGHCPQCGTEVKTWSCQTIHCPRCGSMTANYNLFDGPYARQRRDDSGQAAR